MDLARGGLRALAAAGGLTVVLAAITQASQDALAQLRDGGTFDWSTVSLLGLVVYVYAVEVERRRWDIVLAGLALLLVDFFNEMVNSAVFAVSDRAPLWAVTGETSYQLLIGLNVEIVLLFAVTGVVFVKQLPADPAQRILGVRNRPLLAFAFALLCTMIEVVLHTTGSFHWEYWWWNWPCIPLVVAFGYGTFFAIAAYVHDLGADRRRQLRIIGGLAAIDAVLAVGLGAAGWL